MPRRLRRCTRGTSLWKRRQCLSVIKRVIWIPERVPGRAEGRVFKGGAHPNDRSSGVAPKSRAPPNLALSLRSPRSSVPLSAVPAFAARKGKEKESSV